MSLEGKSLKSRQQRSPPGWWSRDQSIYLCKKFDQDVIVLSDDPIPRYHRKQWLRPHPFDTWCKGGFDISHPCRCLDTRKYLQCQGNVACLWRSHRAIQKCDVRIMNLATEQVSPSSVLFTQVATKISTVPHLVYKPPGKLDAIIIHIDTLNANIQI